MVERNEHLEYPQGKYRGEPHEAVINELNRGNALEAHRLAQENKASISEKGWGQIEDNADGRFRNLTPKTLPEGSLSEKQAEAAVFEAEKSGIDRYGEQNQRGMQEVVEMQTELKETEHILLELQEAIDEAMEEAKKSMIAKPVGMLALPIAGNIWGIIKGRRLKKSLAHLEELYAKLNKDGSLDKTLKSDKISPNSDQVIALTGGATIVGGYAALPLAAAAGPAGIAVAATTILAGAAVNLIGAIKSIFTYKNVNKTYESLKQLSRTVSQAQQQNAISQNNIEMYRNAYRAGAHDNIQRLMN